MCTLHERSGVPSAAPHASPGRRLTSGEAEVSRAWGTCPRPPLRTGTRHTRLDFLSTAHRRSDPVFHDEDIHVDDILSDTVSDDRAVKQPSIKWAGVGGTTLWLENVTSFQFLGILFHLARQASTKFSKPLLEEQKQEDKCQI